VLSVLVRVEAESESLNELSQSASALALIFELLHEVYYNLAVDGKEKIGHFYLNGRVQGPVIFNYLIDKKFVYFLPYPLSAPLVGVFELGLAVRLPRLVEELLLLTVLLIPEHF